MNESDIPAVAEEAVIFDEGGTPCVLDPAKVLDEARGELSSLPNHLSLARPYWMQLQQIVYVLGTHGQVPTASETAEMARLIRRIRSLRGSVSP